MPFTPWPSGVSLSCAICDRIQYITILVRLAQREEYGREYKGLSEEKELESGSNIITLTPFFYAEANSIRVG
jgi:hypothetical protein